jgi:hypothetical protein
LKYHTEGRNRRRAQITIEGINVENKKERVMTKERQVICRDKNKQE